MRQLLERPAMTGDEFRAARRRLGMSVSGLARTLNVDARTVRRWEAGDRDPNPVAVRVMGWMLGGFRPPEWEGQR